MEKRRYMRLLHWFFRFIPIISITAFVFCPTNMLTAYPSILIAHELVRYIPEGHLNGVYQGRANSADFSQLDTGDILLCHNTDGRYGYWTHAAIYVGNGKIIEAYSFSRGTQLSSVDRLHFYDEVRAIRVLVDRKIRTKAAEMALLEVGKPYDFFMSVLNPRSEYCSKLVWRAFYQQGVQLCTPKSWVFPDDLAKSALVKRVDI